jgi:hypothetical protein
MMAALATGVAASLYLVLLLVSSVFGMHEQDTIDLSAVETKRASDQKAMMKTITSLGTATRYVGFASLALGVILAVMWVLSVVQNLNGH